MKENMKNFKYLYKWNDCGTVRRNYTCISLKKIKKIIVNQKKDRIEISIKYGFFRDLTLVTTINNTQNLIKSIFAGKKIITADPYGF